MKIRHLAFAALLACLPIIGALAQGTLPEVPADDKAADRAVEKGSAPNQPGDASSSAAGDKNATATEKSGGAGNDSK